MVNLILRFYGTVKDRKFIPDDAESFMRYVHDLEGMRVVATMTKFRQLKPRSGQQNDYYWGVEIEVLREELGYTKDEMHEILKYKFLSKEKVTTTKKGRKVAFRVIQSTTELTTAEFESLMSEIRTWASTDLNIYIPEPNEVNFN